LNKKGQLTATASPAQPRRPEILRLATAYELYGGLWRRLGGLFMSNACAHSCQRFVRSKRGLRGNSSAYITNRPIYWLYRHQTTLRNRISWAT